MERKIIAKTSKFCFKKYSTKYCLKNILFFNVIISLLIISLSFSGCGPFIATSSSKIDVGDTSNVNSSKSSSSESAQINESNESTTQTSSTNESANNEPTSSTENSSTSESTTETTEAGITVKVYYANADGSALVGEERIVGSSHKYLEAFLELTKPPINPGLVRLVPETTKINKLTVKSGNIDLDLSKNIIDDRFKSDLMDILLVHSIVNTLTEFKEINTVTFYIDGKKGTAIGEADISVPIFRDESYIQKN
jgi:spore germination protein GerM